MALSKAEGKAIWKRHYAGRGKTAQKQNGDLPTEDEVTLIFDVLETFWDDGAVANRIAMGQAGPRPINPVLFNEQAAAWLQDKAARLRGEP